MVKTDSKGHWRDFYFRIFHLLSFPEPVIISFVPVPYFDYFRKFAKITTEVHRRCRDTVGGQFTTCVFVTSFQRSPRIDSGHRWQPVLQSGKSVFSPIQYFLLIQLRQIQIIQERKSAALNFCYQTASESRSSNFQQVYTWQERDHLHDVEFQQAGPKT
jgi:hypothetical protein